MRLRRQVILLLFVFAASGFSLGVCFGQTAEKASAGDFDHTRFDKLRLQGYEALYSLDYEEARRLFHEMARCFQITPRVHSASRQLCGCRS